jgi:membrane protease YdiL (CAAX protease family)
MVYRSAPLPLLVIISLAASVHAFQPISFPSTRTLSFGGPTQFPSSNINAGLNRHSSLLIASKATSSDEDELFDPKTTMALVGGQSVLVAIAIAAAMVANTPNYGFGPGISFSAAAIADGVLKTIPLGVVAYLLDFVESKIPALQDVTSATQRSVMALLGGTFKPTIAISASLALGLAAGFGEEMLFRGVLQYELAGRLGETVALGVTSIIFGLLHAITPAYAILATIASVYFGYLYQSAGNLAVPITTHALYDVGALLYAHWLVSRMTKEEQQVIIDWEPTKKAAAEGDRNV